MKGKRGEKTRHIDWDKTEHAQKEKISGKDKGSVGGNDRSGSKDNWDEKWDKIDWSKKSGKDE